ncbi:hypothetical protein IWX76_003538 [Pedobacter sp. CAN_A7]|uniref:M23 family metallopeptidase n=1 Tax=Pedobacter sp. CAN_A7 TaxID=2787722 RepID=UPI0018C98020
MKLKKIYLSLMVLSVMLHFSCKKEIYDSTGIKQKSSLDEISSIKEKYFSKKYGSKLLQTINDTTKLDYNVDWENYEKIDVNDSLSYYHFPMIPYSYNPKSRSEERYVKEINQKKYLIVGKSKMDDSFRVATYYSDSIKDELDVQVVSKNFSGSVTYFNLDANTHSFRKYRQGSSINRTVPKKVSGINSSSTTASSEDCYMEFRCSFNGICDGYLIVTSTLGKDACASPKNFYPSECRNYFTGWEYVHSDVKFICIDDYPDPGIPGGPGTGPDNPTPGDDVDPDKIPCLGDPIKSPTIARSNATNINGGRYGYTRTYNGKPKFHHGTDIYAPVNTPVFPLTGGTVIRVVRDIAPGTYIESSFGNYIEIESVRYSDGKTIKFLYAHLNSIGSNIKPGTRITTQTNLGLSGNTGNAAGVDYPHVHIEARKDGIRINPEPYIRTKFNTNGTAIVVPCP